MRIVPIAIAATALTLSACSGGTPSTTPSPLASSSVAAPSPSATPSPSASPSPSVSAAAHDCSLDEIVPGRLGCIDTNLPASGNPGAAQLAFNPDYCSPGVGRWTYTPSPDLVSVAGHDTPHVWRIDVYDPALTTPEGIHVGSTEAEVVAAYPGVPFTLGVAGTKLLVVTNAEGSYTIELADGWGADPEFTVANIRIYAAGETADYAVYGTEDFAAYCPMDV